MTRVPLRFRVQRTLWLCVTLLVVGAASARSQDSGGVAPVDTRLEAQTRAVAAELRCPVCQGNSIQDSPSELAQDMKAVVREQLAAGKSPEEVKQYFIAKYGEWILLEPKASGFNLVVYALPVILLLLGAVVISRAVRRWTATPESSDTEVGL